VTKRVRRARSLVTEVLGAQLATAALVGIMALAGLAFTSGSVIRTNLSHWAALWAGELNELGAPFYLSDRNDALFEVERFVAKYPEIARVSWYDLDGQPILALDPAGPAKNPGAALTRDAIVTLAARMGVEQPYLLAEDPDSPRRFELSAPIWQESFSGDGLFDFEASAATPSVELLGFVSLELDFSVYESAFLPNLAIASVILFLILCGSWALGRVALKRALAPLSALQTSLRQLSTGETNVPFPETPHAELDAIVRALENTTRALQKREKHLLHLANHDQLTGLHNRHRLVEELDNEAARLASESSRSALFFIDLDQFKYVNDTCGHAAGDQLLQLAAQQIRSAVREEDFVARFGGDEFVVLVRNVTRAEAKTVATQVLDLMRGLKHVERDQVFPLQCSIGVAMFGGTRFSPHELIAQADIACQAAKSHGRNRVEIYGTASKQSEEMAKDVGWMNRLRGALDNGGFELNYQPLLHIKSRNVSHYEALLRLKVGDEHVSPQAFLPAAVRFGLMADIDHWVVENAIRSLAELRSELPNLKLSVNVSSFAFEDDRLGSRVRSLLREHGVSGDRLVFEITEQLAVRVAASTDKRITLLRDLGCGLAIDDFGTGYSSFSYLKRLPVDFLKIDGSFIKDLPRDPVDQAMVRMVGEVAKAADIETVAEYVNDAATLTLLAKYGIDYAQGFYVGHPTARPEPADLPRAIKAR
jgi:diguanylate cyclase (GGDEF)-like protein